MTSLRRGATTALALGTLGIGAGPHTASPVRAVSVQLWSQVSILGPSCHCLCSDSDPGQGCKGG